MDDTEFPRQMTELKERLSSERPAPWEELPDLSLYMDQVVSYLGRQLITFHDGEVLTSAMINNYIKDGIAPRAHGKRYEREHLAALTTVAVLKQVLSVRDLATLMEHSLLKGTPEECYARLREGMDRSLTATAAQLEVEDLPELAATLALQAYADLLACRRILELLRGDEPGGKDKKKKK